MSPRHPSVFTEAQNIPTSTAVAQSVELGKLAARIAELEAALLNMLCLYTELANSGDAGFWDCEREIEVIAARAALRETLK